MRINANIMAVNTHRQLFASQTNGAKSMEKLSSGYRINRAADDAAGLAISEKMRSQIRGMKQASRNAQDGISVVQTAEGALDEVHSMLQRMKELTVQSASDSNQSVVDREALQKEVDALTNEINSITEKTQFNKMRLLDGSFKDKQFHVGANSNETIGVSIESMTARGLGLDIGGAQDITAGNGKATLDGVNGALRITTPAEAIAANNEDIDLSAWKSKGATAANPFEVEVNINGTAHKVQLKADDADAKGITQAVVDKINEVLGAGTAAVGTGGTKVKFLKEVAGKDKYHGANVQVIPKNPTAVTNEAGAAFAGATAGVAKADAVTAEDEAKLRFAYTSPSSDTTFRFKVDGKDYEVQIAKGTSLADAKNAINAALKDKTGNSVATATVESGSIMVKTVSKGVNAKISAEIPGDAITKSVSYDGVNILTREAANKSLDNIQSAIENLASRRAELGAVQNRIEHTIKNLDNSHENLMAAESRVRHVDMALEIIESTRNNILQQAATSMLAQANQAPQTVLSLLR